jgi:hypothetical protein
MAIAQNNRAHIDIFKRRANYTATFKPCKITDGRRSSRVPTTVSYAMLLSLLYLYSDVGEACTRQLNVACIALLANDWSTLAWHI